MDEINRPDEAAGQSRKNIDETSDGSPSEFAVGLVTFIVFIIFMSVWMYLGLSGRIDY